MISHTKLLNLSSRVFRKLLKIYPSSHHDRFKEEMIQDFRDLSKEVLETHGRAKFVVLWIQVGLDLIKTALEEYLHAQSILTLEKLIRIGAISSWMAAVLSGVLAFSLASPYWIDWVFFLDWIWLSLGVTALLALSALFAFQFLNQRPINFGLWLGLLGAFFMTAFGLLMPTDIKIWRLFLTGLDLLAAGLIVQAVSGYRKQAPARWTAILLILGLVMLMFNQLTPGRNLGILFNWDGTFFGCLMGLGWAALGTALLEKPMLSRSPFKP